MRKGEVSLQPGPHAALGLPAYAQVTSPLRRYQDLAVHRQIARALALLHDEQRAHPVSPAQRRHLVSYGISVWVFSGALIGLLAPLWNGSADVATEALSIVLFAI